MNKDMKQTKPTGEKQLDKQVSEVQRELHWRFPCSTGMCNVCLAKQTKPTEHAKKKNVTTGTLKKKAWKCFSIFIRTRDCIATTGDPEYGICVTCEKRFHFKELQAGHYVSGRNNAVLFHEDLVRAQCMRCNVWLGGNKTKYALYMFKHYTPEQMEEFELLRNQTVKRTVGDYEMMIEDYKKRTKALSGLRPAPGRKKASD